jgi:spore germination cell wall hydrolase CwlJ-like protein
MKRVIAGILAGLCVLTQPVTAHAHERQCPKTIEVTQAEAVELMQIASAEALNQGTPGMLLVMSVVMNRVSSSEYPDNIHDVIHQPHQFYTAGMKSAEITPDVHMALAQLEMGCLYPEIVAFERTDNNVLDVYFSEAFNYGAHTFYTSKIN